MDTPSRGGAGQPEDGSEEFEVGEVEGPDVVVDAGTYDVPRSDAPIELHDAKIATRQEWVRAVLAVMFVLLLALVVIWGFLRTSGGVETTELLDRILPAVTGLLGSVVGFYFATKQSS
jgi:hypothetical protein